MRICGYEILPLFDSEIVKILLGALIGFVPAVLVAMYTQFRTDKRDKAKRELDEKKSKLADAKYVFLHSIRLINTIISTSKAYLCQANKIGKIEKQPIWTKILPIANLPPASPKFNIDRLGFLLETGCDSIVNELLDLESVSDSILKLSQEYNDLREQLLLEIHRSPDSESRIVGNMASNLITSMLLEKHFPEITKLNDITNSMLQIMKDGSALAIKISQTLGETLESSAGKESFSYTIDEWDSSFLNPKN